MVSSFAENPSVVLKNGQIAEEGTGPELLAKGIYEALVCTLAALMVAIPILMVYYYFIAKIERLVAEMNENSLEFADHFLERAPREGCGR